MIGRVIAVCCVVALVACSSPGSQWSKAIATNTIGAYQEFLAKYPTDVHATDARSRIVKLQDEQAWTAAQLASSVDGYQQYLSAEPNGAHAQTARTEIETRQRAGAWQTLQGNENAASLQSFLQKYPSGDESDQARAKLKQLTAYRAELGTAHTQKAADHKREELERRLGKIFTTVVIAEPDSTSHEYRITSAPMSEQDANGACARAEKARQTCKVIQSAG
jgi:hypothetical protein